MYNHPALRGMKTFQKGIKTVVSGTMLAGLNVAGVTRLKRPQDAGYRPAEARVEWASPGMLFRHGLLRAAWARIPSPRNGAVPAGNTPFPQGIYGGASATPASLKRIHPSLKEYPLAGRDCAFPEGNGTLPVNPLNLADPPAAASRGEHTPAHAGRSNGSRPPSPSTAAHGRRNVSHPCAAAASRQCREQNRSAARQPPSA